MIQILGSIRCNEVSFVLGEFSCLLFKLLREFVYIILLLTRPVFFYYFKTDFKLVTDTDSEKRINSRSSIYETPDICTCVTGVRLEIRESRCCVTPYYAVTLIGFLLFSLSLRAAE